MCVHTTPMHHSTLWLYTTQKLSDGNVQWTTISIVHFSLCQHTPVIVLEVSGGGPTMNIGC